MANEENKFCGEEDDCPEEEETSKVWETLSPDQKKYFKKLAEKSSDNMRYIG